MDNQHAVAGSAEAQQHFLNSQAGLFLFDLKNEATEHGLKASESWMLQLATEAEVSSLKRNYHPVVSLKLQPHALLKIYHHVKNKLQQPLSKEDAVLSVMDVQSNEKHYLAAYMERGIRK